jgi:hypothetical protein
MHIVVWHWKGRFHFCVMPVCCLEVCGLHCRLIRNHLHDSVIAGAWATFLVAHINRYCCYNCDFLEMSTSYASIDGTTYNLFFGSLQLVHNAFSSQAW